MDFLRLETFYVLIFGILTIFMCGIFIEAYLINFKPKIKINGFNYTLSKNLFFLKWILFFIGWIFFGIAFFGPVKDAYEDSKNTKDIIFILDVSKSMDATDCQLDSAKMSRINCAKKIINTYILKNPYNNYGLIAFAGEALNISPLTNDIEMFVAFLNNTTSSQISKGGTNLQEALKIAMSSGKNKNLILLSDGEDLSQNNLNGIKGITKIQNIKIFGIGLGSTNGAYIPNGNDFFGNVVYKNYEGQKVTTKLDEKTLKNIANEGDGYYIKPKNSYDITEFDGDFITSNQKIDNLKKKQNEISYDYILIGFCLLSCSNLIQYKRLIGKIT